MTPAEDARDQGGPPCLMRGAEAQAGVSVKVLVEQNEVSPVRVDRVPGVLPIAGPAAMLIRQKQPGEPSAELISDLLEVHPVA